MADVSQVAQALVDLIAGVAYPAGTGAPSLIAADVRIYHGWPLPAQLDTDLAAGKAHVTVWPTPSEKNTTRYNRDWEDLAITSATITATTAGVTVTLGGTVTAGQVVLVNVDGRSYARANIAGDTLASIAAAMAALVAVDRTASSAGPILAIPGALDLVARVATTGNTARELRREDRVFQISIWCNTPTKRDLLAAPIDRALAKILRMDLPDGSVGLVRYRTSVQIDEHQKAQIYRRNLMYSVEYPTLDTDEATTVGAVILNNSRGPTFDAQGPATTTVL